MDEGQEGCDKEVELLGEKQMGKKSPVSQPQKSEHSLFCFLSLLGQDLHLQTELELTLWSRVSSTSHSFYLSAAKTKLELPFLTGHCP